MSCCFYYNLKSQFCPQTRLHTHTHTHRHTDTQTHRHTLTLTHTHTHTQSNQTALCHVEGSGNYAGQVECLFPSTTGGIALDTHTHARTHTHTHTHILHSCIFCLKTRDSVSILTKKHFVFFMKVVVFLFAAFIYVY